MNELNLKERLKQEKEYLGIYVSGHPLDKYKQIIKKYTNTNCQNLNDFTEDETIFVAGMVVNNKEYITKRNNKMAFITIEDWSGKAEIVVFPDVYDYSAYFLDIGNIILISGYKDDDSFIARKIVTLEDKFLELDLADLSLSQIKELKKCMVDFSGGTPLLMNFKKHGILVGNKYWINLNSDFESKLDNLIGENRYKVY